MVVFGCSFILLWIVFTSAFKAYYLQQKQQQLIQQADRISEQYALSIYTGVIDAHKINSEFRILRELMASTLMIERSGRVMFASADIDEEWIGRYVSGGSLAMTMTEGRIITESIGAPFEDAALTVIYPMKINNTVFAALLMNVSSTGVNQQLAAVYRRIFAALFFCAVMAFIVLYFFVRAITKPLIEINNAAGIIAGGDFKKRIRTDRQDEVGQLAKSFNEMAESLSRLEENERLFISNISHDIRTPLTSILGFASAMSDGTAPYENFSRYLNIIKDEAKRIIKLTNEMIEVNRSGLELGIFDINGVIRSCACKFEDEIRAKNLDFELIFADNKTMVSADTGKIERVLGNLLDNAVKYTDNGMIKIETSLVGGKVLISVSDTGCGISENDKKHIFERFYMSDASRSEGRSGHGLGLSIVKQFILAHGENISVKSEKNKGSVFSFSLPIANNLN